MAGANNTLVRTLVGGAIVFCTYATWAAWRGPPPRSYAATPSPLDRTPSDEETELVQETADRLTKAIRQAQQRLGQPIPLSDLEGQDPLGQPHLPYPIPDNPLNPGVSTTSTWCGETPRPEGVDWLYCPETSTFTPGLPQ